MRATDVGTGPNYCNFSVNRYYAHRVDLCVTVLVGVFFSLLAVLLGAASLMFVIRIVLVIWRHIKQPLYEDAIPESMSPMEIAEKQKKIFR